MDGPALKGTPFIDRWREDRLEALHAFIKTNMPQDAAGKLAAAEYVDLTAYLLQSNGYKAGSADLAEAAIESVFVVGKDGPKPLPSNTLVETAGCLQKAGTGWNLGGAADLRRTRSADQVTPAEQTATRSGNAGAYQLRGIEEATTRDGKAGPAGGTRVVVKGALVRGTGGDRINVLSWEPAGPCS